MYLPNAALWLKQTNYVVKQTKKQNITLNTHTHIATAETALHDELKLKQSLAIWDRFFVLTV